MLMCLLVFVSLHLLMVMRVVCGCVVQKALKEKEEHIEQLLRERDLERSEVARAAAQVDEVRLQDFRSFLMAWRARGGEQCVGVFGVGWGMGRADLSEEFLIPLVSVFLM